jgi:hypothetical protein
MRGRLTAFIQEGRFDQRGMRVLRGLSVAGDTVRRRSAALALVLGLHALACSSPTAPEVFARPQPFDTSRVRIVLPEVYELANIIIAMTTFGRTSPTAVFRTGEYYQRVNATFSPFRDHSSMEDLQLGTNDPLRRYYELRDNSVAYVFEDDEIRRDPASPTFWEPNLFRERLAEVQQFARVTNFRSFFGANVSYYRDVIDRYRAIASVDSIADWLEREFQPVRYRHYTVVLSPLVYGSHSAHLGPDRNEASFLVSGPDVTSGPGTSAGVRQATVQRILFTEVDHAFVNPATDLHRSRVISAFGSRAKWTTDASSFYNSPVAVFNEYMTWATFLLFADGRLPAQDFQTVRDNTVQLMEGSRRFHRFGAFHTELSRLYRNRPPGGHVTDLYPAILDWAATQ